MRISCLLHLAADICKMQADDQNSPAKENQTTLKTSIRSHLMLIDLKPTSCSWPILLLLLNYNQTQCGFKSFVKCVTLHLHYLSQWKCVPHPCLVSTAKTWHHHWRVPVASSSGCSSKLWVEKGFFFQSLSVVLYFKVMSHSSTKVSSSRCPAQHRPVI